MSRTNLFPLGILSWDHILHTWKSGNDEFQKQVSSESSENIFAR